MTLDTVVALFFASGIRYAQVHEQLIRAVNVRLAQRLAGDGHDASTVLPGAFGDELLDPQTERVELRRRNQRDLVPSRPRAGAHHETKRYCRIRECRNPVGLGCRKHRQRPADDFSDVLSHQRGRHQAEEGQRGIASADV